MDGFGSESHRVPAVEVEAAPAFELVVSLWAYAEGPHRFRSAELNQRLESTVSRLSSAFKERVQRLDDAQVWGVLLALAAEMAPPRTVAAFFAYLDALPPQHLAEQVSRIPEPRGTLGLPAEAAFKLDLVMTLREWHDAYFRSAEPEMMAVLEQDAEARRSLAAAVAPQRVVEVVTGTLRAVSSPNHHRVLLVPQYHQRPWVLSVAARDAQVLLYPAGSIAAAQVAAGLQDTAASDSAHVQDAKSHAARSEMPAPPEELTRLTRALGDERRLRILRLLAGGDRDFRELAAPLGLSKSTIHHHLNALRSAGLVESKGRGMEGGRYSLRREALADLLAVLQQYMRVR